MRNGNDTMKISEEFEKSSGPKFREVSSRFLSPVRRPSTDAGILHPNPFLSRSPSHRKSRFSSAETRKQTTQEGFSLNHGLWPSAATSSSSRKYDTLADHLGIDRLLDVQKPKNDDRNSYSSTLLERKISLNEFVRVEEEKESSKENHRPIIGGSMRITSTSTILGKSASRSSSSLKLPTQNSESGRLSIDVNHLYGKSCRRQSLAIDGNVESESNHTDAVSKTNLGSPFSGKTSTRSSRKTVREVPSNDKPKRTQSTSSDLSIQSPRSFDSSTPSKNSMIKSVIKRTNSMSGYGSATSQWALSPSRSDKLPMSVESKEKPMSFSSLKPLDSSPKAKGMEKLLSFGFDLFKNNKISSANSQSTGSSASESVHQLRLLHNRLFQWRFTIARADSVNKKMTTSAEENLIFAWNGISNLRRSLVQKKLRMEREKMEMKLILILVSQLKSLETWGDMERHHITAVSTTKKCLHSVVCRVPLIEGAQVETQSMAMELRQASNLIVPIKRMLIPISPSANKTASLLWELAKVIAEERLLLEECFDLCRTISTLEIQEMSLNSSLIQVLPHQQAMEEQTRITA